MPAWTSANGQDDLVWHNATVNGSTATAYISSADHNGESGKYITHVYVTDKAGGQVTAETSAELPSAAATAPKILQVQVSEVSASGYRVTVSFTAANGVAEVLMPTWTSANGQDDLVWHVADASSNKATCYIKAADHGKAAGEYITHVYVRDNAGAQVLSGAKATVPGSGEGVLAITKTSVTEVGTAGYRVTVNFTAPNGVKEVLMPTWTSANGQDDLVWHIATVSGNSVTYYVRTSEHKNGTGAYITHVYVRDLTGAQVIAGANATVPAAARASAAIEAAQAPALAAAADYSLVFDAAYYLERYADLREAFGDDAALALQHFLTHGMAEGRVASASFNVRAYRANYADLQAAFGDALPLYFDHYLRHGQYEGRRTN